MSKHAARQFILARSVLGLAAAVLLALVGWIAFRSGGSADPGDPLLVLPTADLQAAEGSLPASSPVTESSPVSTAPSPSPSVSRSASASPSASASLSPSPSRSAATSAKPSPSKSTGRPSPSPSRTSSSPAAADLSVTYSTSASWRDGFIAALRVTNNGTSARDWTVTLSYPSGSGIELRGAWNATAGISGNTVTLRGKSLAGGSSVSVGFQAEKDLNDLVKPVTCAIGGGSCRVS
ncbi:cellulose-binding domain-containing protein [Actinoplanes hulinensis]|uniref:Cellulose-binding domain-containing protein n=1 Tax=Actinoplanes hulinensis TaxID=1144547 RepID=A0ABS7AW60_9ACTN|nr:cellulose binding domain-containing protein [Actinoplanes hulinensis]MBW6432414.1 cellulose-binding domain-containing protein [Actinoplanes hulinensis]